MELRKTSSAAEAVSAVRAEAIEPRGREEVSVIEPGATGQSQTPIIQESNGAPRFQIFIIDTGWDSPAHRVLRRNFGLIRNLRKSELIYVLNSEKSIEFIRHHRALLVGKDPIIAVHDLHALGGTNGTTGFHGFRLHLGLLRTEEQALLALQAFSRFLSANRQSRDLEALVRAQLRREGFLGAIEIILRH